MTEVNENGSHPDGRPISQCFMDDLWQVLEEYSMSGITNAEALGMMQIVQGQFLNSILEEKDGEEKTEDSA